MSRERTESRTQAQKYTKEEIRKHIKEKNKRIIQKRNETKYAQYLKTKQKLQQIQTLTEHPLKNVKTDRPKLHGSSLSSLGPIYKSDPTLHDNNGDDLHDKKGIEAHHNSSNSNKHLHLTETFAQQNAYEKKSLKPRFSGHKPHRSSVKLLDGNCQSEEIQSQYEGDRLSKEPQNCLGVNCISRKRQRGSNSIECNIPSRRVNKLLNCSECLEMADQSFAPGEFNRSKLFHMEASESIYRLPKELNPVPSVCPYQVDREYVYDQKIPCDHDSRIARDGIELSSFERYSSEEKIQPEGNCILPNEMDHFNFPEKSDDVVMKQKTAQTWNEDCSNSNMETFERYREDLIVKYAHKCRILRHRESILLKQTKESLRCLFQKQGDVVPSKESRNMKTESSLKGKSQQWRDFQAEKQSIISRYKQEKASIDAEAATVASRLNQQIILLRNELAPNTNRCCTSNTKLHFDNSFLYNDALGSMREDLQENPSLNQRHAKPKFESPAKEVGCDYSMHSNTGETENSQMKHQSYSSLYIGLLHEELRKKEGLLDTLKERQRLYKQVVSFKNTEQELRASICKVDDEIEHLTKQLQNEDKRFMHSAVDGTRVYRSEDSEATVTSAKGEALQHTHFSAQVDSTSAGNLSKTNNFPNRCPDIETKSFSSNGKYQEKDKAKHELSREPEVKSRQTSSYSNVISPREDQVDIHIGQEDFDLLCDWNHYILKYLDDLFQFLAENTEFLTMHSVENPEPQTSNPKVSLKTPISITAFNQLQEHLQTNEDLCIFNRSIFDATCEVLLNSFPFHFMVRETTTRIPFGFRAFLKRKQPKPDIKLLHDTVKRELTSACNELLPSISKEGILFNKEIARNSSLNRIYDACLDETLRKDMLKLEKGWRNYEEEELKIIYDIGDAILDDLLEDTVNLLNIMDKK